MTDFISVKTSSPAGDLISFMAGFKQLHKDTRKKVKVYQRLGMVGVSYDGSLHPFTDKDGQAIAMNEYMFNMLAPLICSQPYIEDYVLYAGEKVDFDMDMIRHERQTLQPRYALNRWFGLVFPQMQSDLSSKWMDIYSGNTTYCDKVIINFTQRHRHHIMTYYFLSEHKNLVFVGLKSEHEIFCKEWNLDIPYLEVNNFFELAKAMKGCKFFMGNASFCYQLAEAMKIPRMLELFPQMPNIVPIGENAHDYVNQGAVEYLFNKMNK